MYVHDMMIGKILLKTFYCFTLKGQASLQQQQQWQQQQQGQLPPGAPGQPGGQMAPATSHPSPQLSPATPGGAAGSPGTPMSPGAARMVSPLTPGGPRPTWSGETHPALAQVPRTPQQLQHLQRLQLQRDQVWPLTQFFSVSFL